MSDESKPVNPPAFPSTPTVTTATGIKLEDHYPGMTLRDYFAGQALAGMLAHGVSHEGEAVAAEVAYSYADDMLKARGG